MSRASAMQRGSSLASASVRRMSAGSLIDAEGAGVAYVGSARRWTSAIAAPICMTTGTACLSLKWFGLLPKYSRDRAAVILEQQPWAISRSWRPFLGGAQSR